MRLDRAVDRYLTWRQVERDATESSHYTYWRRLAPLLEMYPDATLADFEGRDGVEKLRRYVARWARRSASTRANVISVLHSFFDWAEGEDLMETNPSRKLRRPPKRRPNVYRPTGAELLLARRATTLHERGPWLLMEGLGFRNAEVRRTRWRNLDLTRGRAEVKRKGGHWQTVPIPPDILTELQAVHRALNPDPEHHVMVAEVHRWVAQGVLGQARLDPLEEASSNAVWRLVKRVCKRAGIRELYPHQLRHGFATRHRRHGLAREHIQFLMGHAHPSTTERYMDALTIEEIERALTDPGSRPTLQAVPAEATAGEEDVNDPQTLGSRRRDSNPRSGPPGVETREESDSAPGPAPETSSEGGHEPS